MMAEQGIFVECATQQTDSSNYRRQHDGKYCPRLHSQHVQAAIKVMRGIDGDWRRKDSRVVIQGMRDAKATPGRGKGRIKGMAREN
jgi:hypothetical protein